MNTEVNLPLQHIMLLFEIYSDFSNLSNSVHFYFLNCIVLFIISFIKKIVSSYKDNYRMIVLAVIMLF